MFRINSRRWRLILLPGIWAILHGLVMAPQISAAADGKQPNIILLIADDLGWNDVGYHGSEIRTPTLDRMARDGLELDAFYSFPVCTTTRAALETGINPAAFGIRSIEHPFAEKRAIPKSVPTVAERLKPLGYKSHMIGKWHLSASFAGGPIDRGYDSAFGYLYGQIDHFSHLNQHNKPALFRDTAPVVDKGHMTDLITREARRIIAASDKPFFLNIRYSAPHYPLQAPEPYIDRYAKIENADRRVYAAMVTHMDDSIGEIVAAVKQAGKLDNTIFLFFSDNGAENYWRPKDVTQFYGGRYGPYSAMGSNWPLNGQKTGVYEGGIRVPAIAYGPGLVEQGKADQFLSVLDLMPTILGLAGAAALPELEGADISPVFRGARVERDVEFYWLTSSDKIPYGGGKQDAVRMGDWKYIESQQRFKWLPYRIEWPWKSAELYDLSKDPNETNNLVDEKDEIAETLRGKLHGFIERTYGRYE